MKNDPIEDMPDAAAPAPAATTTKKKPPAKKKITDVLTEDLKQLRTNVRKHYPAGSIPTETPSLDEIVQVRKYYKDLAKVGVRKLSEATGAGLKVVQSATYSKEEKVTIANAVAAIKSHQASSAAEGSKGKSSRKEVADKDLYQHNHFFILIDPKTGLDQFALDGRLFNHLMPKNAGDKYDNSTEPVLVKPATTHMKQLQCFKKLLGVPKKDIVQEYTGLVPKEVLYSLLKGPTKERKKKDDADESGGDDDENEDDNEAPAAEANDDAAVTAPKTAPRGTALSGAARSDKSKILSAEDAKELLAKISSSTAPIASEDDKSPLSTFQTFIENENLLDTSFAESVVRYFFVPKDPSPDNMLKKFRIFQRYAAEALEMNVEDETVKSIASLCVPGTEKPANLQKETWDNNPLMAQVFLPVALSTAVAYHKVVQPGLLKIVEEEQSNFRHTVRERFEAFVARTNESIKKAEEETAIVRASHEQIESKLHSLVAENEKKCKNYEATIELLRRETDKLRATAATASSSKKRPAAAAADQEENGKGGGNSSQEDDDDDNDFEKKQKKPAPPSAKKTAVESPQSAKPIAKPLPKPTPAPQLKPSNKPPSKPGAKPLPQPAKPSAKPTALVADDEFPDD